jgi:predicted site-specific integrase-resolvase
LCLGLFEAKRYLPVAISSFGELQRFFTENRMTKDQLSTSNDGRIRAVQYVRMSTEYQQYSIDNQAEAIGSYALQHRLEIVRTYADAGKSGLKAENRPALKQLIEDV